MILMSDVMFLFDCLFIPFYNLIIFKARDRNDTNNTRYFDKVKPNISSNYGIKVGTNTAQYDN
mgnify:CR=1 FL=1